VYILLLLFFRDFGMFGIAVNAPTLSYSQLACLSSIPSFLVFLGYQYVFLAFLALIHPSVNLNLHVTWFLKQKYIMKQIQKMNARKTIV
jgi:hypothetical protein